ncbi:MAG: twin-arginine translocase TatA/TatE family subunit [Gemmatimonadetes bacterium]|nr:twin-arginine translocase TatA/TatE family subunit [Gemmatimonadota bacterium]
MPFNVGPWELLLILLGLLLVFGAKRLPEMGAAMGKGIREFKKNISEVKQELDRPADTDTPQREIDQPASSSGDPKKLSE